MKKKPMNNSKKLFQDETLQEKFISRWRWIYIFTLLWAPLVYFSRIVMSNDLSVSEIGIFYSLISLIAIVSAFNDLWLRETLNFFLPKHWINRDFNKFTTLTYISLFVKISISLLIWVVVLYFITPLSKHYLWWTESKNIVYILVLFFIFFNLLEILKGFFQSVQDTFSQHLFEFGKKLFIALWVFIVFIFWVWDIANYSFTWMVGMWTISLLALIIFSKKYWKNINKGKFNIKEWQVTTYIKYWLLATLWTNAMILLENIDQQMILYFLWTETAWYYANFISLMMLMTFLFIPLIAFIFPVISEIKNKKQDKKLQLLQNFFYKYFIFLSLVIGMILSSLGDVISILFFWENYIFSWILLTYVAIFWVFKVIFMINFAILMWLWQWKSRTLIILFVLILNIIWNLILIPLLWAIWAGIATIISWIIIASCSLYLINKNCKISFDYKFFIKNLFLILWLWGVIFLIKWNFFVLDNDNYASNLLYLLLSIVVYLIIIFMFNSHTLLSLKKQIIKIKK